MTILNDPLVMTLVILGGATVLFLSDRLRPDLVALLVAVSLGVTGVLDPHEAFSGFSRTAVITLLGIFIVAEGLRRTGLTEQVGVLLVRVAGRSEARLVVTTMIAGAFLSLFMNNVAATSVLLPAASGAARRARVHPSRLLMPLAFGTTLGGMATLLTSANIVVSSFLTHRGLAGFGLLSFAPVGGVLVIAGVVYMAVWGRRRLPWGDPVEHQHADRARTPDLVRLYRLDQRLFRARVPRGSALIGTPLSESSLRDRFQVSVVGLERDEKVDMSPSPDVRLREGDVVLFEGSLADFRARDVEPYLDVLPARRWRAQDLESEDIAMTEAMLSPRSRFFGRTLRDVHFREKYGMTILAIWRAGLQIYDDIADTPLRFGDALLLQGPRKAIALMRDDPDLILLAYDETAAPAVRGKGGFAFGIALLTLIAAAARPELVGEIMLGGALAMMLTNVITTEQAYAAISWPTVFVVAGMLPLGLAMTKTGAAALLAERLVAVVGPGGPMALLAGLFVLGTLLVQAMNSSAVASILAPVAIPAAVSVGVDPRAVAMGVALATSMTFITPFGHPVNMLVMGSGNYKMRDFFRVGVPLAFILFAVTMLVLPVFWPLAAAR